MSAWERMALSKYVQAFNAAPPNDTREALQALVAEYKLDQIMPPKDTIPVEQAMQILARENQP